MNSLAKLTLEDVKNQWFAFGKNLEDAINQERRDHDNVRKTLIDENERLKKQVKDLEFKLKEAESSLDSVIGESIKNVNKPNNASNANNTNTPPVQHSSGNTYITNNIVNNVVVINNEDLRFKNLKPDEIKALTSFYAKQVEDGKIKSIDDVPGYKVRRDLLALKDKGEA